MSKSVVPVRTEKPRATQNISEYPRGPPGPALAPTLSDDPLLSLASAQGPGSSAKLLDNSRPRDMEA